MTRILAVLVAALLSYEAAALNNTTPGDTISEVVWSMSDHYGGIVGLLFGVLMGALLLAEAHTVKRVICWFIGHRMVTRTGYHPPRRPCVWRECARCGVQP